MQQIVSTTLPSDCIEGAFLHRGASVFVSTTLPSDCIEGLTSADLASQALHS